MSGPPPTAPPPPATPPPAGDTAAGTPAPRRLTRHPHGRLVSGVAAGLARYLGVDPVLVRIGFVVLAFLPFPGFGLLVYVAMVLLVPQDDQVGADGTVGPVERTPAFWFGMVLLVLGAFSLVGVAAATRFEGLLPLLLIGLGVALWVDADRRPARAAARDGAAGATPVWGTTPVTDPPAAADPSAAADTPAEAGGPAGGGAAPPVVPPPHAPPSSGGPAWTPPPVQPRDRSPLGRVTVGLALLAGGAAWSLDLLGVRMVSAAEILAVILAVLGLGLLVGSVVGRARWLTLVVAVVLPLTLAAAMLDGLGIDLRGGIDRRVVVVDDAAELDGPLTIGAGQLTVDLTQTALADGMVVDARVGAGQLEVLVPAGVGLTGAVRVEVGDTDVLGDRHGGVAVHRVVDAPADAGEPLVVLDLRVGAGEVVVRHLPTPGGDAASGGEGTSWDGAARWDGAASWHDVTTSEVQP